MALGADLVEIGVALSRTSPGVFWAITLAEFPAAALLLWLSLHNLRCKHMIEEIATSKIRSAPQGYVELAGHGRLMDGPPIISPASGQRCLWYRYRVEEWINRFGNSSLSSGWVVVENTTSSDTFWLEDDTGRVAIDPDGAEVTAAGKKVWYSDGKRSGSTNALALFLFEFATMAFVGNKRRFTEEIIELNAPLFALGMLRNTGNLDNSPDLEEEVGDLLVEWKKDQTELKRRFDLNQDGEIDQQEWMLARQAARREVLKQRREQESQPDEPINLMRCTNDLNRPYLLSTKSRGAVTKTYQRRFLLYFASFLVVCAIMIWLLRARFGS